MSEQRTPGPWRLDGKYSVFGAADNEHVCSLALEANAAFIVRAANAHDKLVAALEEADDALENNRDGDLGPVWEIVAALKTVRAALALAKADKETGE